MRKWTLVVFGMLSVAFTGHADAQTPEELFSQGNAYYEAKQYDSAIISYRKILSGGLESATVYFNLANASFRTGDLGHAVLYYLRAKRLNPSDDDIQTNLAYAQSFTSVQMEGVRLNPIRGFLENLVAPYHLNLLAWFSSLFFILFFVLLTVRYGIGRRGSLLKGLMIATFICLVVASGLTTFKYDLDYRTPRAVLIADDCPVYSGPTEQAEVELQGAPGLVVEILDSSGDFYNVQFQNSRRGWIRKRLLERV